MTVEHDIRLVTSPGRWPGGGGRRQDRRSGPDAEVARVPRRVMLVSANMGGGHDAAARALAQAVRRVWPGSEFRTVDTLDVMGPGVGPLLRRLYVSNIQGAPYPYEFFYATLWRQRWFARASKRVVGAWVGRGLAVAVRRFDPDLILSTYPMGSAGLGWLRRHRGIDVPMAAWISDFAPHPFWVYDTVDANVVVHPAAVAAARAAEPGAAVRVCAPPVVEAFGPGDRTAARRAAGLPVDDRFVAVVSCGSYGFGAVEQTATALLRAHDSVRVVVVGGRNEHLVRRLARLGEPADRLLVLGWVDDMAALTRAADVVVTNAGGVTALEALVTGRPIVMYQPIPAHGVGNAALMSAVGLAETCHTPAELAAAVRTLVTSPDAGPGGPAGAASALDATGPRIEDTLRELAGGPASGDGAGLATRDVARDRGAAAPAGVWPARAGDAFFRYAATPHVPQQIGGVVHLAPVPGGAPIDAAHLAAVLGRRIAAVATLHRRLVRRPGGRYGWVLDREIDPAAHISVRRLPAAGSAKGDGDAAERHAIAELERFWAVSTPADRPAFAVLVLAGWPDGHAVVAIKLDHALCDGVSAVRVLTRLLDPVERSGATTGANSAAAGRTDWWRPPRAWRVARTVAPAVRDVAGIGHGLARLATAGRAPRTPFNAPLGAGRRLAYVTVPVDRIRTAGRRTGTSRNELCLGLMADALARTLDAGPVTVRAMLPVSRHPRERDSAWGNWTAAATVAVPLGAMPVAGRLARITASLRDSRAAGEPRAAALAMRAMGLLPAPLHARLARLVYGARFFNIILSVVPGSNRARSLGGADVPAVFPIVGLAPDVPVGAAAMRWADRYCFSVLVDGALERVAAGFPAALRRALDDLESGGPAGHPGGTPDRLDDLDHLEHLEHLDHLDHLDTGGTS